MQKLIITIETDANISKQGLTLLGCDATNLVIEALKPYWHGVTVQSSKVEFEKN